jgi:hypothetical protein
MSCPYCRGTKRIPIEPGSTTAYDCPDCRNETEAPEYPDERTCDDRDTITD